MTRTRVLPDDHSPCGWLQALPPRPPAAPLQGRQRAAWVVVGAGYTGLSAARTLALSDPGQRVILLEAGCAGEGASARNSGFLVDSTLNDGHLSDTGLQAYRQKYALNHLALRRVERLVGELGLDCQWQACGKFHAASSERLQSRLRRFAAVLGELGLEHRLLEADELRRQLGTDFYRCALHTTGGVLLQPAALARGLVEALPPAVDLSEQSPVLAWTCEGGGFSLRTPHARIATDGLIFAVNGFMPGLGVAARRVFPLLLSASLTRPLSESEFELIGRPRPWGVLSALPMGATLRLTADRRLMIRNTAEVRPGLRLDPPGLASRRRIHALGLQRRFPGLPGGLIESTWTGVTCISANNANVFESPRPGLYAAGCYNGGGIGLATLFGEQIALFAQGQDSAEIGLISARAQPRRLPPQPLLNWGVRLRLARDRLQARRER